MNTGRNDFTILFAAALLFLAAQRPSLAGSATWATNPSNSDWNSAENWMPQTVPNSPSDIATFGASNVTAPSITNMNIDLDSAVFNSGASPYTINVQNYQLNFDGAGIKNNSGVMQSFVLSSSDFSDQSIYFYNTASAGEMTSFTDTAGGIAFYDSASAGSATINLTYEGSNTYMDFNYGATAANATINASGGSYIIFYQSSGGNATFNLTTNSYLQFGDSNAEHANVNCNEAYGILFLGSSSAGDGTYTMIPGNTTTQTANTIYFANSATAGDATFILNGSMAAGLLSTYLLFFDTATAANANVTAYGGSNGGPGAAIEFHNRTEGGTASFALLGNSTLDIGKHMAAPATLGSLSGSGTVFLGARTLALGRNNASTTFSGVIQDSGGISHNTGGSLSKVGTGTLILTGTNLYTGGTTVSTGGLEINNQLGSGTGTGNVNVQAGTLGGQGIISGAVAIGTGSGSGAFLAPAAGTDAQATLTIQSALTFNADATYNCTFRAKRNRVRTDKVVADGVTINTGASIALSGQIQGALTQGLIMTLISNTSANPISGTFSNLPDGGIVTINGNNFQASYEGGDGNDLTLTVVP